MPDDLTRQPAPLGACGPRPGGAPPTSARRCDLSPSRLTAASPRGYARAALAAFAPVASVPMWLLMNTVRHYPWGSRTVIPDLLGEPSPADRPYAELWMGAHPDEPSVLSNGTPLDKAIEG